MPLKEKGFRDRGLRISVTEIIVRRENREPVHGLGAISRVSV